jgi:drug/metabolite transporter (DMT)-like permease
MQVLLNQLGIPLTMLASMVFLKSRFKVFQLVGAALIVSGIILAGLPFFLGTDDNPDDGSFKPGNIHVAAIIIFGCSQIPGSLSNVYKEMNMKDDDLNVFVTTTYVSLWQMLLGFGLLPLVSGGFSLPEMKSQMVDGFVCYSGHNIFDDDDCESAFWTFTAYVLINFAYNVTLLNLTKHGSAVLLVMGSALALPLTNLAFTSETIMGDDVEPFSIYDLLGLLLVCVGFLIYSGFGYAKRFFITQGAPGNMAFTPVEGSTEIKRETAADPRRLAWALTNALIEDKNSDKAVQDALVISRKVVAILEETSGGVKAEALLFTSPIPVRPKHRGKGSRGKTSRQQGYGTIGTAASNSSVHPRETDSLLTKQQV